MVKTYDKQVMVLMVQKVVRELATGARPLSAFVTETVYAMITAINSCVHICAGSKPER